MAAMMLSMTEKSDSHVYQLPEGMKGGMTLDRCSEIEKAEASGEPIKLTYEERARVPNMARFPWRGIGRV